jgi:hypothetical protein
MMSEDEEREWLHLEKYDKLRKLEKKRHTAVVRSNEFCDQYGNQLGHFTLRQVYELGYMKGIADELGL